MVGITRNRSKLTSFIVKACVIMFLSTLIGFIFGTVTKSGQSQQVAVHRDEIVTVYDRPQHVMPTYYQFDERWSHIAYLGGDIASHGCGLTCAAMAFEYVSGTEMTPKTLFSLVGDTCSTAGVNDMKKFADWIKLRSEVKSVSDQIWTLDGIKQADLEDALVFCGLQGKFGDSVYSGHVILMFEATDDGVLVRDPASTGNTRFWSWSELEACDLMYFYIVRY